MESTDYLQVLRRRWKVVAAAGVLAVLARLLLAPAQSLGMGRRTYTATATLIQPPNASRPVAFTALLVTNGPVPQAAAARLAFTEDPAALARSVSVDANQDSGSIRVS